MMNLTLDKIQNASGASATNAGTFMPYLIEACNKYAIDSPVRLLSFLSQVGHESGGLYYTEELASGAAYEGRADLGNNQPGDGIKFKGRGLIQITGRNNYKKLSDDLGVELIAVPSKLGGKNITKCAPDQLRLSALSAGWYWNSRKINGIADKLDINKPIDDLKNMENFILITKKINGGLNGLADRVGRYKNGWKFFK